MLLPLQRQPNESFHDQLSVRKTLCESTPSLMCRGKGITEVVVGEVHNPFRTGAPKFKADMSLKWIVRYKICIVQWYPAYSNNRNNNNDENNTNSDNNTIDSDRHNLDKWPSNLDNNHCYISLVFGKWQRRGWANFYVFFYL